MALEKSTSILTLQCTKSNMASANEHQEFLIKGKSEYNQLPTKQMGVIIVVIGAGVIKYSFWIISK